MASFNYEAFLAIKRLHRPEYYEASHRRRQTRLGVTFGQLYGRAGTTAFSG